MNDYENKLGKILKQQRLAAPLTLQELSAATRVSSSHLGRIERGERYPSARILRRIAKPLGFDEDELFTLAGFLTPQDVSLGDENQTGYTHRHLDPTVARMLAEEPVEVQRAVLGILSIMKTISHSMRKTEKEQDGAEGLT